MLRQWPQIGPLHRQLFHKCFIRISRFPLIIFFNVAGNLLPPSEAKDEMLKRLTNVVPDLPAFGVVVLMGFIGASLAHFAHLSIGGEDTAPLISKLSVWLLIAFGGVGSAVSVFLIAKTDTSKLIHCALIALLSGMAGPYLVIKALGSVLSVSPDLVKLDTVKIDAAAVKVTSNTTELAVALQAPPSETNPQKIIDIIDQTAQSAATYLNATKEARSVNKGKAVAAAKPQLRETLATLKKAAPLAPQKSLALITKLASEAEEANAKDIAQEARDIIAKDSVLQNAARSGQVYFIAPAEVSDSALKELVEQIEKRFPLAEIQPVVHPTRAMDPGLEIVYYGDSSQNRGIAEELSKVVDGYLKNINATKHELTVRKGVPDKGVVAFQFDIHLGPDIAKALAGRPARGVH
jgi:hypothetical protein